MSTKEFFYQLSQITTPSFVEFLKQVLIIFLTCGFSWAFLTGVSYLWLKTVGFVITKLKG